MYGGVRRVNLPRVVPVSETSSVTIRSTAEGDDQGEEDNTDDGDDLERREPELELTKESNTKVVDDADDDEEDGDEYTRINRLSRYPVLDDESSSRQLVGRDDDVFEPVSITCQQISIVNCLNTHVQPSAKPSEGSQNREA